MNNTIQYLYGLHAVEDLLTLDHSTVLELMIAKTANNKRIDHIIFLAEKYHIPYQKREKLELDHLFPHKVHQGIIAKYKTKKNLIEKDLEKIVCTQFQHNKLFLILDEIQDPHNFGACIRSANAMGVDAIIVPKRNSSPLSATARKSASGAAERTPIIWITNLARTLRYLKKNHIWLVGATGEAQQTLYEIDLTTSIAMIVGNEGKGLRRLTKDHCDFLVRIPMYGIVDSLNVSVATGILLSEAMRQRKS